MNITLDRRSKTSLSQQMEIELRSQIIRGDLPQHSVLPKPSLLAAEHGMTEDQVIQAYHNLVLSNHLAVKNNDWIVNYGRVSKFVFEEFVSLVDIMRGIGAQPSIKTLLIKKDYKLPKDFGMTLPFKKILYARRLYLANDRPLVLMDCYFPQDLYPGMTEILESNQPYYKLLKPTFGLEFQRSERSIEASNLRKREAEILEVPTGTTYSYSIVKTYDTSNRLIEVDVCWVLPDSMHFTIEQDE